MQCRQPVEIVTDDPHRRLQSRFQGGYMQRLFGDRNDHVHLLPAHHVGELRQIGFAVYIGGRDAIAGGNGPGRAAQMPAEGFGDDHATAGQMQ